MKISIQILALVALFALVVTPDLTEADSLVCGDVITKSVKLDVDLLCPDLNGLIVDGNNITIDLGAHTLEGSISSFFITTGVRVLPGSHNVTIKNGIIDGFDWGVIAEEMQNLTLDNLVIRDQLKHYSIAVNLSKNVVIKNSSLFGPDRTIVDPFVVGIELESVDGFDVENVDVHGYSRGLMVSCWLGNCTEGPNSGKIRNSNFYNSLSGISIDGGNHITITGNHISDCIDLDVLSCAGLAVAYHGMVRNLKVENNTIHGMRLGIALNGVLNGGVFVTDSKFVGNHLVNNFGGIYIQSGVTGNVFRSNILFNSLWYDLYHDNDSVGNAWIDNSCEFKIGDEIPDCP